MYQQGHTARFHVILYSNGQRQPEPFANFIICQMVKLKGLKLTLPDYKKVQYGYKLIYLFLPQDIFSSDQTGRVPSRIFHLISGLLVTVITERSQTMRETKRSKSDRLYRFFTYDVHPHLKSCKTKRLMGQYSYMLSHSLVKI